MTTRPRSLRRLGGTAPGREHACPGRLDRAAGQARRLTGRAVRVLAAALALAGLTGAGAPGSVPGSSCAGRAQPPNPSGFGNVLSGVAVLSSCNAWAVGGFSIGSTDQTLIVHWNGTRWLETDSPNPSGDADLNAVASTSARNIWAVGQYTTNTGVQTLIAHWGGSRWRQQPSPNPGGPAGSSVLYDVAAVSAGNAWAVGYSSNGTANQTLIVHWNGSRWRQVPSPNPGGPASYNALDGVAILSARNIWAVGAYDQGLASRTLIVHWNGTSWRQVPSPNPGDGGGLDDVAAASSRSIWAVGNYHNGIAGHTLIVHWDGTSWRRVPSPDPGGSAHDNFLFGVGAASAGNAWAVGQYSNGAFFKTLAIRCC